MAGSEFIAGAIFALCIIGFGYWLGQAKRGAAPEPNILVLKAEKRALLRELRERIEHVALQDFADRERYKVRLQEISTEIATLDEELGSSPRRINK